MSWTKVKRSEGAIEQPCFLSVSSASVCPLKGHSKDTSPHCLLRGLLSGWNLAVPGSILPTVECVDHFFIFFCDARTVESSLRDGLLEWGFHGLWQPHDVDGASLSAPAPSCHSWAENKVPADLGTNDSMPLGQFPLKSERCLGLESRTYCFWNDPHHT